MILVQPRRLLLAVAAVLLCPAAAAHAEPCGEPDQLFTSSGAEFSIFEQTAMINESQSFGHADDTWDFAGEVALRVGGGSFPTPVADAAADCPTEDDGREVVVPPTDAGNGLQLTRKIYVPIEGAFARILATVTNTGGTAQAVDVAFRSNHFSDDATVIPATSSGDAHPSTADHWAVHADGDGPAGSHDAAAAAFNWQSPLAGADTADVVSRNQPGFPNSSDTDEFFAQFDDAVVPPGGSVTYMVVFGQGTDAAAAEAVARRVATTPLELTSGMTAEEIASVRNWSFDADGDGLRDSADNCPTAANAGQADLDGDGTGDACDDDADGDGLTNGQEQRLGLDPRRTDSDGDGQADGVDRCPTRRGTDGEGCPLTEIIVASPPGTEGVIRRVAPRGVTARASSRRRGSRLTVTTSGRLTLPTGLRPSQGCDFGVVTITVKAGTRTISTRYVEIRRDCTFRSSTVFRGRSRFRRARRLDVTARFNGNAFLLRRAAARQKVPVR